MHFTSGARFLLFALIAQSPAYGMQLLKNVAGNARYYLLPASANPVTWFNDNFSAVQEGACYRSKTVSPEALKNYIEKFGIKTILNLREASGVWFEKEDAAAKAAGVALKTITLNGRALPTTDDVIKIFKLFENKEAHPILIHCQAGADRTGLAAAFWKLTQQNASLDQALAEQVASKGHFEWRFPMMKKFTHIIHGIKQKIAAQGYTTWQEALSGYNHEYEMANISLPSLPVRAAKSFYSTIKNNPKVSALIAAGILTTSVAAYAHKKDKLIPALEAAKEKIFGKAA